MIHADPDPIAMELEDLGRELRPWLPRADDPPLTAREIDEALACFGLRDAFPNPEITPSGPDPRDIHAGAWAWIFGLGSAGLVLCLAFGCAIHGALGLPIPGGP
jgi:hypothetical protein